MSGQIEITMICQIDSRSFGRLRLHLDMQTVVLGQCEFDRCGYFARISFVTIRRTVLQCNAIFVLTHHLPVHLVEANKATMQLMFVVQIARDLYLPAK